MRFHLLTAFCALMLAAPLVHATSNYEYEVDEYDTIMKGISPDGKWAITAHGGGDYGYDNFHIYLTDAVKGKKIGPLEEIVTPLDTGADAYCAHWSADSQQVMIVYRIDRHEPLKVMSYRVFHGRAFPLTSAPVDADDAQAKYWSKYGSGMGSSPKIFGTPKAN